MRNYRWMALSAFMLTICSGVFAQTIDNEPVQMADQLRANGKIYVVVAVIIAILVGVIAYLIRLDRKISKLEKGL